MNYKKDIYFLHINGKFCAFSSHNNFIYLTKSDNFIKMIEFIRDKYQDSRLRCINNEGIKQFIINETSYITDNVIKMDNKTIILKPNVDKLCYNNIVELNVPTGETKLYKIKNNNYIMDRSINR